jgi:hypothetical protein
MNHLHAPAIDQIRELDDALGVRRCGIHLLLEIVKPDRSAAQ